MTDVVVDVVSPDNAIVIDSAEQQIFTITDSNGNLIARIGNTTHVEIQVKEGSYTVSAPLTFTATASQIDWSVIS